MFEYFDLSKQQHAAATAMEPRVLTIAGAGSGKTRVLVGRVMHIFGQKVDPQDIMCITFTRKAANEMRERIGQQLGEQISRLVWVDTFHATCLRMIREFGYSIGYKKYTIFDQIDRADISKHLNTTFRLGLSGKNIDAAFKHYDGNGKIPGGVGGKLVHLYLSKMRGWQALDFGMIINECHRMLMTKENVRTHYQNKFKFVLVDEYQDTDPLQQKIIDLIEPENLFVVGDDYQSIFGWRNSDITLIMEYPEKYKPAGVGVYKLEQNYRSTMQIVAAANRVISHNENQMLKNCWSEKQGPPIEITEYQDPDAEAISIVERIKKNIRNGMPLSKMAILYRKHSICEYIIPHLKNNGVNFRVASPERDFWESKEVRGLQAVLLALQSGNEHHLKQALDFPEPVMPWSQWLNAKKMALASGRGIFEWMEKNDKIPEWITAVNFIRAGIGHVQVEWIIEQAWTMLGIMEYYEERGMTTRIERLKYFQEISRIWDQNTYGNGTDLQGFLEWIRLRDMQMAMEAEEDAVSLLTVHSAKGLEWESVFLVGLEEGNWPIKRPDTKISEERRLFYVGITRAEKDLHISYVPNRIHKGNRISRFLKELEGDES